jgi:hypothetical protein
MSKFKILDRYGTVPITSLIGTDTFCTSEDFKGGQTCNDPMIAFPSKVPPVANQLNSGPHFFKLVGKCPIAMIFKQSH